jgi:hypothetical protein
VRFPDIRATGENKGNIKMARPSGALNRTTIERQKLLDAMTAANATPLSFLLAVLRSESPLITMDQRISAARSALPYVHPRVEEVSPADEAKLVEAQCYEPHNDPLLRDRPTRGVLDEDPVATSVIASLRRLR